MSQDMAVYHLVQRLIVRVTVAGQASGSVSRLSLISTFDSQSLPAQGSRHGARASVRVLTPGEPWSQS